MAKKSNETGCSLAVSILVLALFGVYYALPYLITAIFYSFPALLVYLFANSSKRVQPELADISNDQIEAEIKALHSDQIGLLKELAEIRNGGVAKGARFLHQHDRFEMRSRRGQELNESLDYVSALLADVTRKIKYASNLESKRLLAWRSTIQRWRQGRPFRLALLAGLIGCVGCVLFLEWYYFQYWLRPPDLLVWNPFPGIIRYTLEIGTVVGWVSALATLYLARRYNSRIAERDSEIDYFDASDDGTGSSQGQPEDPEPDRDPYEVLNVSPEASVQDIKKAYHAAIKRCHPDTVADRSDYIREAAREEAQLINDAYERILGERGCRIAG